MYKDFCTFLTLDDSLEISNCSSVNFNFCTRNKTQTPVPAADVPVILESFKLPLTEDLDNGKMVQSVSHWVTHHSLLALQDL